MPSWIGVVIAASATLALVVATLVMMASTAEVPRADAGLKISCTNPAACCRTHAATGA
jgi:hypothetical protein